jgi:hypothetical protein
MKRHGAYLSWNGASAHAWMHLIIDALSNGTSGVGGSEIKFGGTASHWLSGDEFCAIARDGIASVTEFATKDLPSCQNLRIAFHSLLCPSSDASSSWRNPVDDR